MVELILDYFHIFERDFKIEVNKRSGIQWQDRCPLPSHEDRKTSFSWNIDNGLWKCHGCFESGNAYQLAEILNIANPSQFFNLRSRTPLTLNTLLLSHLVNEKM